MTNSAISDCNTSFDLDFDLDFDFDTDFDLSLNPKTDAELNFLEITGNQQKTGEISIFSLEQSNTGRREISDYKDNKKGKYYYKDIPDDVIKDARKVLFA